MKRSEANTQVAQHCWSCFDFGMCLAQSFCRSCIVAQQLDPMDCGIALCNGCASGPSDANKARKTKIAVTLRISAT
ncbi:MAG: hypothetical protein H0X34_15410 [Chthoniobacterales bacterium]|nr:hypothetical protein [Chthoniobacterales bacterium]